MYADYIDKRTGKRSIWRTSFLWVRITVTAMIKTVRKKTEEVEALNFILKHEAWEQRGYSLGSNGTSED